MKTKEQTRFDKLCRRHLRALKLQGLSDSTIDVYSRGDLGDLEIWGH